VIEKGKVKHLIRQGIHKNAEAIFVDVENDFLKLWKSKGYRPSYNLKGEHIGFYYKAKVYPAKNTFSVMK